MWVSCMLWLAVVYLFFELFEYEHGTRAFSQSETHKRLLKLLPTTPATTPSYRLFYFFAKDYVLASEGCNHSGSCYLAVDLGRSLNPNS
jgi:hypothetical protein